MKRVAGYIEKSNQHSVSKSYINGNTKKIVTRIYNKIYDLIKIATYSPDAAIIDSWGESRILVWLTLRIFRRNTKIFTVFHHHEESIPVCKNWFETFYNFMMEQITSLMLKNSYTILTVSKSSIEDLTSFYNIGKDFNENFEIKGISICTGLNKNKVAIVGTGVDVDLLDIIIHQKKKIAKKKRHRLSLHGKN